MNYELFGEIIGIAMVLIVFLPFLYLFFRQNSAVVDGKMEAAMIMMAIGMAYWFLYLIAVMVSVCFQLPFPEPHQVLGFFIIVVAILILFYLIKLFGDSL